VKIEKANTIHRDRLKKIDRNITTWRREGKGYFARDIIQQKDEL
jgi:hypothetical protein